MGLGEEEQKKIFPSPHLVIVNVSVGGVIPHTEQAHQAVIRHLVTIMVMMIRLKILHKSPR